MFNTEDMKRLFNKLHADYGQFDAEDIEVVGTLGDYLAEKVALCEKLKLVIENSRISLLDLTVEFDKRRKSLIQQQSNAEQSCGHWLTKTHADPNERYEICEICGRHV